MRAVFALCATLGVIAAGPIAAAPPPQHRAAWLVVVDELHIDFTNTGRLRTLLRAMMRELFAEGDVFSLRSTGPSQVSLDWTTDRTAFERAVKDVTGHGLKVMDIVQAAPIGAAANEVHRRAAMALSRASALVTTIDPGGARPAVIYVSNGYVGVSADLLRIGGGATPIFTIDPRLMAGVGTLDLGVDRETWTGYWQATRHSLRLLSEQSGGAGDEEGQDVSAAFARIKAAMQAPSLQARFVGNMAFAISDGAFTLMSDFPYDSGAVRGYMTYDASEIRSATAETLSLITHRHGDHWSPTLFPKTAWKVVGPRDVTAGVPADRVVPVSRRFPYGPLVIDAIETPHAGIGHYSYVVTWHGRRLYFSGDTEEPGHLIALEDLDVAFVSPWLYRAVLKRGGKIDAARVVIYHHGPGETVPECREGCHLPRQGEMLRF